ncbi:hypothetical protein ACPPVQ_05550 [Diaminobutyricibacter sp. McL0618]|uniref:hypothetical protein n=1 Tax=Leifsonia sp. McL0618 TaxID=3415677 RepID=UPI003CE7D9E9
MSKLIRQRWIGALLLMVAWLVLMVGIVVGRIQNSPLGPSTEVIIGLVTSTLVVVVVASVVWAMVRPNILRRRYLLNAHPDGLVITVRRTRDLMDIVEAQGWDSSDEAEPPGGLWLSVLIADRSLSIWAGKERPLEVLSVSGSGISSISRGTLYDAGRPFAGLEVSAQDGDQGFAFALIPSSDLLGGLYPALPRTVESIRTEMSRRLAIPSGAI